MNLENFDFLGKIIERKQKKNHNYFKTLEEV